jgi:hypothetical protein
VVSVDRGSRRGSPGRVEHDWTVQRRRPSGSFLDAYGHVLSNTPEWGRAATSLGSLPRLTQARIALVAKVESLRGPSGGAGRSGHARLAVQVMDFDTWTPRCTRELEVVFPPRDSSVPDTDFNLAFGLSNGAMLSVCHLVGPAKGASNELCRLAGEYATVVSPSNPGSGTAAHGLP